MPTAPTNITATPCYTLYACLLVSWESQPGSNLENLRGVFQGFKVVYCEEGEPCQELLVPPAKTENGRPKAELTNISGYTYYTVQVLMVTLYGHGLPSRAITVLSGESGKKRANGIIVYLFIGKGIYSAQDDLWNS